MIQEAYFYKPNPLFLEEKNEVISNSGNRVILGMTGISVGRCAVPVNADNVLV